MRHLPFPLPLTLTLRGVEREFGIPRPTLRHAIASGQLHAAHPGPSRTFYVLREDVLDWLRRCAVAPECCESGPDRAA